MVNTSERISLSLYSRFIANTTRRRRMTLFRGSEEKHELYTHAQQRDREEIERKEEGFTLECKLMHCQWKFLRWSDWIGEDWWGKSPSDRDENCSRDFGCYSNARSSSAPAVVENRSISLLAAAIVTYWDMCSLGNDQDGWKFLVQHYSAMNWNWRSESTSRLPYFHHRFSETCRALLADLNQRRSAKGKAKTFDELTLFCRFSFLFAIFRSSIFKPNLAREKRSISHLRSIDRQSKGLGYGWLTFSCWYMFELVLSWCVIMQKNESSPSMNARSSRDD